jgi:4-carboxymuconolactone decarboxylase
MNEKRYRECDPGELSAEQRAVYDAIAAPRGGVVPAPFHILLESPELASLTQALGAFCRYRTRLGPQLSELLVLITAAHWQAPYEFAVHAREALKAGLSEAVIAALRDGRAPNFEDPRMALIHEFASEFYRTRDVGDALFARVVAQFGRPATVELAGVLGYYSGLAILLRIFRVPAEG